MDVFYDLLAELQADPELSSDNETDAALEAAVWEEGGEIVEVRYTLDRYVQRRAYFLGQHPNWKHLSGSTTGLFPITRHIAEEIFNSEEEELTTLEIRHREQLYEVKPLLPLTTTQNCQTIDDFEEARTPDAELSQGATSPRTAALPETFANTLATQQASKTQISIQRQRTERMDTSSTSKEKNGSAPAMTSFPTMPNTTNNNSEAAVQSGAATTRPEPRDTYGLAELPVKDWSPEIIQEIHERLSDLTGQPYPSDPSGGGWSNTPGGVYYPRGISSLSSRPIEAPVKTKGKRRVEGEEDEPDLMLKEKASPGKTSVKKKKVSHGGEESEESQQLKGIIDGTELPENEAEAIAAAEIRHKQLLGKRKETEDTSKKSGAKRTSTRNKKAPDLMPEFFETANFAKGEEQDSVRCVCGVSRDDGQEMIACDACNVWQHKACMAEAVPDDLENEGYLCHVCAPYAHRVLIAKLRRDDPL